MSPETAAPVAVQYSYNFHPDVDKVVNDPSLTPDLTSLAVYRSLHKLSFGPTPTQNKDVVSYMPSQNIYKYKIDKVYELMFMVFEEEKKFVVIGFSRFN